MAKGKKTGGRNFAPGNKLGGRPPTPPELKAARRLTKTAFEALINRHLWANDDELAATLEDPAVPAVEKLLASILAEGIRVGDAGRMEWIAQRLIGKVKDVVELETKPVMRVLDHEGKARLELGHAPAKKPEDGSDEAV